MEESSAMAMRRSSDKPAPLPPHSRRRRAPTPSAWPAFPQEINRGVSGLGQGKQSPVSSSTPSRSPKSGLGSSCSVGVGGSVTGSSVAGVRRLSSDSGARVSGCGVKSPGIVRNKASCCDSCRPSSHFHSPQSQIHGKASGGSRIEYDDVFGGPPKYLSSVSTPPPVDRKISVPDYDDIFQGSNRRSFSAAAQSIKQPVVAGSSGSKSRTAELPVFDPPEFQTEVFKASPGEKLRSPGPGTPVNEEAVYDDVFGGPLTGPRTKLLKDLLRCSGFVKAGCKTRASPQSDSSPVSSLHSICREPNPIYEYESEVYGDGKHFNSPHVGSGDKSPQPPTTKYGELETNRKPAVTSLSASSSPFTEQFDDSTVHSYSSTRPSLNANHEREKIFRTVTQPVRNVSKTGSSSSSESSSSESEFIKRSSLKPKSRKYRGGKGRRSSKARASDVQQRPSYGKRFGDEKQVDGRSPAAERDSDIEVDLSSGRTDDSVGALADELRKQQAKQVSFVTVSNVQLKTEPTILPPVRPAPLKSVDILSEKEMSELLETEAFMEYSIKDLDGLVAEEYVVSHESVSESSPSTSMSNSLKTSASGRSYEDEDSDHCYAKDNVSPGAEELAADSQKTEVQEKILKDEGDKLSERNVAGENVAGLEEIVLTSTSEGQLPSKKASSSTSGSGDLSSVCEFEEMAGETHEVRRSRWERHQRQVERVAKALAEKNSRDLEAERAEAEKQRVAELLEDVIKRWAAGKQGNLRALLSTLQYILWPECGWQPVSLIDIIEPAAVRKAYRKATLFVHPDKLQQKNASTEHRFIAEKVFNLLQEAWTSFNYEQMF